MKLHELYKFKTISETGIQQKKELQLKTNVKTSVADTDNFAPDPDPA